MNRREKAARDFIDIVVKAIRSDGHSDLWDPSYNPAYAVPIQLTIRELRIACIAHGFTPTKEDMKHSEEQRAWESYIEELDGAE